MGGDKIMSLNFFRPSLRGVGAQHAASVRQGSEVDNKPISEIASSQPNVGFPRKDIFRLDYGSVVEAAIAHIEKAISTSGITINIAPRWLAIKLLEGDANAKEVVNAELAQEAQLAATRLAERTGEDADTLIADRRYSWINNLAKRAVTRTNEKTISLTDRVDRIVTNKWIGIPIFLFAMWATLKITADVSAPYLDWVDFVISGPITNWALSLLASVGLAESWLESLLVDGVIAGVGGVLVFVPVLMALYFVLGLLEDSGYMARAAFVMDRLMNSLGLHGKSFLPMLIGFGCSVPAFYATRTLENQRDRILTALLVPFMSCSARLPVYLLFAAVFFSSMSGSIVFGMYLLGIVVAIFVGLTLKNTAFKGKQESAFVMELPPYRLPSLGSIWFHVREHTAGFLRKCSSIIVLMSILLWFATAIPVGGTGSFAKTDIDHSLFAHTAKLASPVFQPLGFGSWEAAGALFTGFVAKEVVVSTMAQIYDAAPSEAQSAATSVLQDLADIGTGFVNATIDTLKSLPLIIGIDLRGQNAQPEQTDLMTAINSGFDGISGGHGALAALAFMVFVLVYTPCMAAVSAEKQEFGSRVMWASILGQTVLAWLLALIVFQGGLLLGLG
jgi:ferrous iron transport protein B